MNKALAVLLLFTFPLSAQLPFIESLEVRVHNVDVVVTDEKGRPVTGLTSADFQLLEDGAEKEISHFAAYAEARAASKEAPAAAVAPPPRKFIFYLDQMSLAQPTMKKFKGELDRLFRETMRDGDEAMIVRPFGVEKVRMPFSSDREAVRQALMEAIEKENWRGNAPIGTEQQNLDVSMSGMMTMHARLQGARAHAKMVRNRVQQRLGELRAVVNSAADLPGRKILVLATESLPIEPGKEAFTAAVGTVETMAEDETSAFGKWEGIDDSTSFDWVNLQPLVDEIARSAATGGITIYAVQPEYGIGLLAPGGDIAGATPGRSALDTGQTSRRTASKPIAGTTANTMMVEVMASNTEGTLRTLAEKTGGTWHRGALSFDNLVNEIAADVSSYYSLGYRAGGDLDKPHRIDVRVKGRPKLKVRARQEVIRKSPAREMTDRVVAALHAPPETSEVAIEVDYESTGQGTLLVTVHVPLFALTFVPDGDKMKASFSVHYAVAGEGSDFLSGVHGTEVVELTLSEFEDRQGEMYPYVIPFAALKPQRHTVAIGIMDTVSRQTGFGRVEEGETRRVLPNR